MLSNISKIITPEIYKIIYNAGHMDEIAIIDGNHQMGDNDQHYTMIAIDYNHQLLEEILKYFPLDDDKINPVTIQIPDYQDMEEPQAWTDYEKILRSNETTVHIKMNKLSRDDFNKRLKSTYAIIRTLDTRLYANIIIRKGVVLA